jgi:hypothetical protein
MFEIMMVLGVVIGGLALLAVVAKVIFSLVLLPFQIVGFLVKGLFFLVFGLPLLVISVVVASLVLPFLAVVALPVLVFVGGIILLVKILT